MPLGVTVAQRVTPGGGGGEGVLVVAGVGGAAARDGRLRRGDCLLAVNGTPTSALPPARAHRLLQALPPGPVTLLVARPT